MGLDQYVYALRLQEAFAAGQRITGFDRVMIYRFDHDWNGEVVAEARRLFTAAQTAAVQNVKIKRNNEALKRINSP